MENVFVLQPFACLRSKTREMLKNYSLRFTDLKISPTSRGTKVELAFDDIYDMTEPEPVILDFDFCRIDMNTIEDPRVSEELLGIFSKQLVQYISARNEAIKNKR